MRIRQATSSDVDAILDLLTHYELPRAAFEPYYAVDSTYRPEHSWVAEERGRLLAHLRIYERRMRLLGGVVRMGGIGNVVTHRDARGRGIAHALLDRVCEHLDAQYAVSLLWTHAPALYSAHGWQRVPDDGLVVRSQPTAHPAPRTRRGDDRDIDDALRLEERANRAGTMVRTRTHWLEQRAWLHEDTSRFLVCCAGGALRGYLRVRRAKNGLDVLELGFMPRDQEVALQLLSSVSPPAQRLRLAAPPSVRTALMQWDVLESLPGHMMLRLCSPRVFVEDLGETLRKRIGKRSARVTLRAGAAAFALEVKPSGVTSSPAAGDSALGAERTAHLILRGCSAQNPELAGRPDRHALVTLFPEQDTVVWPSDRF
jgi:N-acetylglutamate synthase-like GNAT family acetyltransferase